MKNKMKNMKVLVALVLVAMMSLALVSVAFADSYTITVENGIAGSEYNAYKVFDVVITDSDKFEYTIASASAWFDTITSGVTADTTTGVYTCSTYGIKLVPTTVGGTTYNVVPAADTGVTAAQMTTLASALYNDSSKPGVAGTIASYSSSAKTITVADLGYYLVVSPISPYVCSLDTTNTDVTMYEKNPQTTIEKEVKDGGASSDYAKVADVALDDSIYYRLTINTGNKVAVNSTDPSEDGVLTDDSFTADDYYTITDQLPTGVVMDNASSVVVTVGSDTWTVADDYTATYDTTENKLTIVLGKDNDFTTKFAKLGPNTDIIITYTAEYKNDESKISFDATNTNTVTLVTPHQSDLTSTAKVYPWTFDLYKFAAGSTENLADAVFQLEKADGTAIQLYKESAQKYRILYKDETFDAADTVHYVTSITTVSAGDITIEGLDQGTYYLHEIDAPTGYNLLSERVTIEISSTSSGSDEATLLTKTLQQNSGTVDKASIENKTGTELPSTGGIGTTIFYVAGLVLVLGAATILIARRKADAE